MRRLFIATAVLLTACQQAETPEQAMARMATESAAAKSAIEAINLRFANFLTGNMADSVASLYMEDGVMLPPNRPAVVGRAAIQKYLTDAPMPAGASFMLMVADVQANGPIAVERGTYMSSMPAMGKTPAMTSTGKYLVHWHDVNGTWMQAAVAWSDDAPMPAPPKK